MGLNIKNERVHELAKQAAAATGRSQTGAIEEALERLLETHGEDLEGARRGRAMKRIHQMLAGVDVEVARTEPGEIRRVEDLYDEATGLPR